MANSMQNITNKAFTNTSLFIWIRVRNKFTKTTRDVAANNQPLPGCWLWNSRHWTANEQFMIMPTVKIKIKDTLTLATSKKNICRWRERNISIRSHGILFSVVCCCCYFIRIVCGDQKKKWLKFLMSAHSSTRRVTQVPIQASCTSTLSIRHGAFYSAHTEQLSHNRAYYGSACGSTNSLYTHSWSVQISLQISGVIWTH